MLGGQIQFQLRVGVADRCMHAHEVPEQQMVELMIRAGLDDMDVDEAPPPRRRAEEPAVGAAPAKRPAQGLQTRPVAGLVLQVRDRHLDVDHGFGQQSRHRG